MLRAGFPIWAGQEAGGARRKGVRGLRLRSQTSASAVWVALSDLLGDVFSEEPWSSGQAFLEASGTFLFHAASHSPPPPLGTAAVLPVTHCHEAHHLRQNCGAAGMRSAQPQDSAVLGLDGPREAWSQVPVSLPVPGVPGSATLLLHQTSCLEGQGGPTAALSTRATKSHSNVCSGTAAVTTAWPSTSWPAVVTYVLVIMSSLF